MANFIAVTGASGSGKTTVASQLAVSISTMGENTLLVFCDGLVPPKSYLCQEDDSLSLGHLLTAVELTEKDIFQGMTSLTDHLAIMGYNHDETAANYPPLTQTGTARLLEKLQVFDGTVIFDCSGSDELFSRCAMLLANQTIAVLEPNAKNAAWKSVQSLPQTTITVLNKLAKHQPLELFETDYSILHSDTISLKMEVGELFSKCSDKEFSKVLDSIADVLLIKKTS